MRDIIEINEERCNGCGLCVLDCAEGAIAIIDGKARLITDSFCDGLGACLGSCPQDALRIIQRPAVPFDEEAAMEHVRKRDAGLLAEEKPEPKGCLGAQVHGGSIAKTSKIDNTSICNTKQNKDCSASTMDIPSSGQWPLKIRLVPANAPFLEGAHILVAADCSAFACPRFHTHYAAGKVVLIGCPKFDDASAYAERLAAILEQGKIASLTVLRMEVPCCGGLANAVHKAYGLAKVAEGAIPLKVITIDRLGQVPAQVPPMGSLLTKPITI